MKDLKKKDISTTKVEVPLPDGKQISYGKVNHTRQLFKHGYPDFYNYIETDPVPPEQPRNFLPGNCKTEVVELDSENLNWFHGLAVAFGTEIGEAISLAVFAENQKSLVSLLSLA